jgi:hypothetical protein
MSFANVLATEFLKLRRTRIPWVLTLVYCLAPLMMGLMMLVLKNPELGRRLGLVATKAQLAVGAADWPTYLQLTGFLFAGGIVVMGIVQAFVFGREYAEGTAKNLLTLPVGRAAIVAAKLVVSAAWFLGMAALLCAEAVAVGLWLDLPGFGPALLAEGLGRCTLLAGEVHAAGGAGAAPRHGPRLDRGGRQGLPGAPGLLNPPAPGRRPVRPHRLGPLGPLVDPAAVRRRGGARSAGSRCRLLAGAVLRLRRRFPRRLAAAGSHGQHAVAWPLWRPRQSAARSLLSGSGLAQGVCGGSLAPKSG